MAQVNFNDKQSGDQLTANDVNTLKSAINNNEGLISNGTVSGYYDSSNQLRYNHHIIPESNANFDIGNAEYKVRHLYLSPNSLWIGDENKIEASSGEVKTKKRNKNVLPLYITGEAGLNKTEAQVLEALSKSNVSDITLSELEQYAQTLVPNATIQDIYPGEDDANYNPQDFEHIFQQNDHIGRKAQLFTNDGVSDIVVNLLEGNVININNNNQNNLYLDIHGLPDSAPDFAKAQIIVYLINPSSEMFYELLVNGSSDDTLMAGLMPDFRNGGVNILTIDLFRSINKWFYMGTTK